VVICGLHKLFLIDLAAVKKYVGFSDIRTLVFTDQIVPDYFSFPPRGFTEQTVRQICVDLR
jgi:hypothetical protein